MILTFVIGLCLLKAHLRLLKSCRNFFFHRKRQITVVIEFRVIALSILLLMLTSDPSAKRDQRGFSTAQFSIG